MVGLLDIAPKHETVSVLGQEIEVTGISARGIAHILGRWPEFRMLLAQRDVPAERIAELAPDAIAAIIAAGTGHVGDKEHEAVADRLPLEAQYDLLSAIIKVTMPGGIGPFVERLTGTLAGAGDAFGKAPAGNSQAQ